MIEVQEQQNGSNVISSVRLVLEESTYVCVNKFGATITSYVSGGKEILFVSSQAVFDNKKAIRGGIPVVFPNFGPWACGPQHGFARTSMWELAEPPTAPAGSVCLALALRDTEATRALWPHAFRVVMVLTLSAACLTQTLSVTNTGEEQFDFTALLHTYLRCPVGTARVEGLHGLRYTDKAQGGQEAQEERDTVTVHEFTDRVYADTPDRLVVVHADGALAITKSGFPDAVVWNPWAEGAQSMGDFGDAEYHEMLCVEAGAVCKRVFLGPSERWTASQTLTQL